jgi:hypothetical protein
MTRRLDVYEVVELTRSAKTRDQKISVLKQHETPALKDYLRGTFDDTIQWNLPDGPVPYTPSIEESIPSNLHKQHMNLKYFVKGLQASDRLNPLKRENLFIQICESVHPSDAKLLESMVNKKQPAKGLTKKIVEEAYPGLILK